MQDVVRPGAASAVDRFLTFAFAAAELLVEINGDSRIVFAEGAFPARFGRTGSSFLGQRVQDLVAREQRSGLGTALELLHATGRIRPTAIRLQHGRPFRAAMRGAFLPHLLPLASRIAGRAGPGACGRGIAARQRGGRQPRPDRVDRGCRGAGTARGSRRADPAYPREPGGAGAVAADFGAGRFGVLPGEGQADLGALSDQIALLLA